MKKRVMGGLLVVGVMLLIQNKRAEKQRTLMVKPSPHPKIQEQLESYFNNKKDYVEVWYKFPKVVKKPVVAMITSHHFLAKELIGRTFIGVDSKRVKRVIIVGPDHFWQLNLDGRERLGQTTMAEWQTPFGAMVADKELIKKLVQEKGIGEGINPFRMEHSIYVLVPFAKKAFPEAYLVPLIFRQSGDFDYYYQLGRKVASWVDSQETIVIISSDFSHQVTYKQAQQNDKKSIALLKARQKEKIRQLNNDCHQCIAFLYGYLADKRVNFQLVSNKNSFDISGKNPMNVTSYVNAYFVSQ